MNVKTIAYSSDKQANGIEAVEQASSAHEHTVQSNQTNGPPNGEKYGWRFWTIILNLCFTSLLTAIEATVTATALPTIAREVGSRELYVCFVNAIFLSM